MSTPRAAAISLFIIVALATGLALAGSNQGQQINGLPIFGLCIAAAFIINWIVYIPSFLNRTERFFDLTGAITNTSLPILALLLSPVRDLRSWILVVLVSIWAIRLGTFLFQRIQADGHDTRFDELKNNWLRFLVTWSLQGLWCSFTLAAALGAITTTSRQPIGPIAIIGLAIWVIGFSIEVMADRQKRAFKQDPSNKGKFIRSGLWAWSRHPNYFGEIVLWIGVALIAAPVLIGWQWVVMISPIFVIALLTRISGIPLLEAKADKRWGGQDDYEAYKANTSILIPRPPSG